MQYVVLFENDPETCVTIRLSYLPLHLEFLKRNAETISAAGNLSDGIDNANEALWVMTAETEEDVVRYVREDPFWATGLRKSFRIMQWRQWFVGDLAEEHLSAA
ncbi:MAG: YciI family protein [Cognatishimia sp.]|uniref:YciI family protein n=1 Tax=Cognatishimia sp. 1_MG-2023 TaxID=3062642 RepID=UPI0026E2A98C|nr:YciI family protein [Cognatishimia sp. 1_MG-2023]MDO6726585.1 YciI family protein [Cognatishimia sp. 1_MG-2023]